MSGTRFVVITDGHWGSDRADWNELGFDGYEDAHDQVRQNIEEIHAEREIEFIAHCGDATHDDSDLWPGFREEFLDGLPVANDDIYCAKGNHDFANEQDWLDTFGHHPQHSFEYGDYGFITTNTGAEVGDGDQGRSNESTSADAGFLQSEIDAFADDGKRGVIVFQHIAPYDDSGSFPLNDEFGVESPDVREQFARPIVKAVFMGHNHPKDFREHHDGQTYIYTSRIGGIDIADNTRYREIEDFGCYVIELETP